MTTTTATEINTTPVTHADAPDADAVFARPVTNDGLVTFSKVLAKRHMGAALSAEQANAVMAAAGLRYAYRDLPVPASDLRMRPDSATLVRVGREHLPGLVPTHKALGHLVSLWSDRPRSLAGVLCDLPAKERAEVFNHYAQRASNRRADDDTVLRTFRTETGRTAIRAVTSGKYQDVAPSVLLDGLRDMGADTFLVRLSPELTTVEAYLPALKAEVARGDVVCARALTQDNHVKGGGIATMGGLLRIVCLNGATIMEGGKAARIRHVGNVAARYADARTQVESSFRAAAGLLRRAADVAFPEGWDRAKILDVVGEVVPGLTGAAVAAAWDMDGLLSQGNTLAGLHNAVTRAAQGLDVVDALEVEALATDLLVEGWHAFDSALPRLDAGALM